MRGNSRVVLNHQTPRNDSACIVLGAVPTGVAGAKRRSSVLGHPAKLDPDIPQENRALVSLNPLIIGSPTDDPRRLVDFGTSRVLHAAKKQLGLNISPV